MRNHIKKNFVALACLAALLSCSKSLQTGKAGDPINFSSISNSAGRYDSKAVYAGDKYDEGKKEHIYWAEGDVIRIYCEQASHPGSSPANHYADYRVSEVLSDKSQANISLDADKNKNGLFWNDTPATEHTFYGVYPSPEVNGICSSISGAVLTAALPQSQNTLTGALTSSEGSYVLAPDLKWQLMTAGPEQYNESNFPASGTVFLTFNPLTTAIQLTLMNDNTDAITIKELALVSAGTQISGNFTIGNVAAKSADGFPTVTGSGSSPLTDTEKTVKLEFASPYVALGQGKTISFTFFLAPVSNVQDLTFQLVLSDGSVSKLRLGYTDGTGLLFPRCKKSSAYNIKYVSVSPMASELVLTLADWQTLLSKDNDPYFDVTFGTKPTE